MLIFTEVPLRLLGYGFAMSEAMKYNFGPNVVTTAHNVGCGFVIAHVVHDLITSEGGAYATLMTGLSALCWEGLASCLIPPVTTFFVCRLTNESLAKSSMPGCIKTWGAFAAGVCLLPLYLLHVDPFVTSVVDTFFASAA